MANLSYPKSGINTPQAMARREAFWRDVIRRWKRSGLPKTEFGNRENISIASLHFWLKELRRRDGARPVTPRHTPTVAKASFVPLRVVDRAQPPEPIELLVGGHTLRLRAGFDPEALREVVRALTVRSC
jgi:hypothetical protein